MLQNSLQAIRHNEKFETVSECLVMAILNIQSLSFKWYFFTTASFALCEEFFYVFMKQLGFRPQQIGIMNSFGIQHILLPILLYVADKYRARKLVIWTASSICIVNCLLPVFPLIMPLPTCFETKSRSNISSKFIHVGSIQLLI